MKLAVFAWIFWLFLVSVTANAIGDSETTNVRNFELSAEDLDVDFSQIKGHDNLGELLQIAKDTLRSLKDISNAIQISINLKIKVESIEEEQPDDEPSELEARGAFSGLYWVTKKALRTLKGVHCTIMYGLDIRDAAQQFINDVNACGGVVSKQVQAVIDTCNNVITIVDNIINLNDKVCNDGNDNEETDGSKKTGWSCFWKLLKQFISLKKEIQKVLSQVKKIPTTGSDASECVTNASVQLTKTFTAYPSYVKTCSKLTNN